MTAAIGDETYRDLVRRWGLSHTVARWLCARAASGDKPARAALDLGRYLEPKLAHLTPPETMADRDQAAARLATALRQGERICIFGDYDCDGITATAILTEALTALGGQVRPLLADRFDGGYGLSMPALKRVLALEPRVVVTCDCGSSDHAQLEQLGLLGIDAIVVDHHLVPEQPLPALAFLNPHRPACQFPFKGLASCGLALSLVAAVRRELGVALDLKRWLDLVAIGTVADVAPLEGDNRALVHAGLRVLKAGRRPGLRQLLQRAKLEDDFPLTGRDIAFAIAPRLNAPGRLGSPELALRLLLAAQPLEASEIADAIEAVSIERRRQQDQILSECLQEIEREGYAEQAALVLGNAGWNAGVVGIVAGRLAERFGLPTVVIGFEGEVGRGSVRGPRGAQLFSAVREAADTLQRFGGHQAACGLELSLSRLDDFRRAFVAAFAGGRFHDPGALGTAIVATFDPVDQLAHVLSDFDRLEPCGEANPRPVLEIEGVVRESRSVKGGHLKLVIGVGAHSLNAFALNQGARSGELGAGARVLVSGDLRPDRWLGAGAVELFAHRVELRVEATTVGFDA